MSPALLTLVFVSEPVDAMLDDLTTEAAVLRVYRQAFAVLAREAGAMILDVDLIDADEAILEAFAAAGSDGLTVAEVVAACHRFDARLVERRLGVLRDYQAISKVVDRPNEQHFRAAFAPYIMLLFLHRLGPGRLDQRGAGRLGPGLGDRAAAGALAAGVLGGHQPGEAYERPGRGEPPPVGDLGGQDQASQLGDAAVAAEPGDRGRQRLPAGPRPQLGLDRVQLGLPGVQRGAVMRQCRAQRRLAETLGGDPLLVRLGPVRPGPPDPAVAQQHRGDPLLGPLTVGQQRRPGPDQVPDRLLRLGRHPDRRQLPGPVQPGQTARIAPVFSELRMADLMVRMSSQLRGAYGTLKGRLGSRQQAATRRRQVSYSASNFRFL